jgi:hypothetical protein
MTIAAKCLVCRNADRRRLIEAGWNAGMGAETVARVIAAEGLSGAVILKHIKEHGEGDGNMRALVVEPDRPMRDRVLDIQRAQVDEVERRIALAKQRAIEINGEHEGETDWEPRDWSYYFDILHKDAQAAIASILKTQGLADKREKAQGDSGSRASSSASSCTRASSGWCNAYIRRTDSRWRALYYWIMVAAGNRAGKTMALAIIILHSCVYRMGLEPPDPSDPDDVARWGRLPYHWWHFAVEQAPAEQVFTEIVNDPRRHPPGPEGGLPVGEDRTSAARLRRSRRCHRHRGGEWTKGPKERGEYAWIKLRARVRRGAGPLPQHQGQGPVGHRPEHARIVLRRGRAWRRTSSTCWRRSCTPGGLDDGRPVHHHLDPVGRDEHRVRGPVVHGRPRGPVPGTRGGSRCG